MRSKEAILNDVLSCIKSECRNCSKDGAYASCGELVDEVTEMLESEHKEGMEEAWEIAREVMLADKGHSSAEHIEIFGARTSFDVLRDLTVHEAKAKIEDNYVNILMHDGFCGMAEKCNLRKTGKHIDLDGLFKQIGE